MSEVRLSIQCRLYPSRLYPSHLPIIKIHRLESSALSLLGPSCPRGVYSDVNGNRCPTLARDGALGARLSEVRLSIQCVWWGSIRGGIHKKHIECFHIPSPPPPISIRSLATRAHPATSALSLLGPIRPQLRMTNVPTRRWCGQEMMSSMRRIGHVWSGQSPSVESLTSHRLAEY